MKSSLAPPPPGCPLEQVLAKLEELAPRSGAEPWDNVGLLACPPRPRRVRRILIALDLTRAVAGEALAAKADVLVCYHPPIFSPLKRLDARDDRTAALLAALQAGMAIYSPHTALDAAPEGLADWLAAAVGEGRSQAFGRSLAEGQVSDSEGPGRRVELRRGCSLSALAKRIQISLGLPYIRIAPAHGLHPRKTPLRTVAVCPGSGASILLASDAEALVTGEMKHHDLLACTESGRSVILCEHAASERGYLPLFARRLRAALGGNVHVRAARSDRGPLHAV